MKNKAWVGSLLLLLCSTAAKASQTVQFSEAVVSVDVSNEFKTLLLFPDPAVLSSCQPSQLLDLEPVEAQDDNPDAQAQMLTRSLSDTAAKPLVPASSNSDELTPRYLRLVPKKKKGSAQCSIRLSSGTSVSVVFSLKKDVHKPEIEFKSLYENGPQLLEKTAALSGLQVFRSFLKGQRATLFVDKTSHYYRKIFYTSHAVYRLEYFGTDTGRYSAWIFRAKAKSTFPLLPLNAKIGDLFYHFYEDQTGLGLNGKTLGASKEFYLFLLARSDLEPSQIGKVLR